MSATRSNLTNKLRQQHVILTLRLLRWKSLHVPQAAATLRAKYIGPSAGKKRPSQDDNVMWKGARLRMTT
jgi:hypothetical protein